MACSRNRDRLFSGAALAAFVCTSGDTDSVLDVTSDVTLAVCPGKSCSEVGKVPALDNAYRLALRKVADDVAPKPVRAGKEVESA